MSQELTAWAAGILEGEGSFIIHEGKIRVTCQMTDEDVLHKLCTALGVGTVRPLKKRQEHWKDAWLFSTGNNEDTKLILDKVLPYMGKRRSAKIQELYEVYERVSSRFAQEESRRNKILEQVALGRSHTDIAKEFGIDRSTVSHLVRRRSMQK